MLAFALLHLLIDKLDFLVEFLDISLQVDSLIEDFLSVCCGLVEVWVAEDRLDELAVLPTLLGSVSQELGQHLIKLSLDRSELAKQSVLLRGNILELHHVLLVGSLHLDGLSLDFLDLTE